MGLHQKQMDKIKVESYKDCVWYVPKIDKCKLLGICGEKYSDCACKKGQLNEFCVWITKFLKSVPKDVEIDEYMPEYPPIVDDVVIDESLLISMLDKVFNGDKKNA